MKTSETQKSEESINKISWILFGEYLRKYKLPIGMGILALALTDAFDVLPPIIIKFAIDGIETNKGMTFLFGVSGIFLLCSLIQGIFRYYWRKYLIGTSHIVAYDLRKRMYEHLQTLSFSYFNRSRTGELMSRLTNDIDEVRQMFGLGLLLAMDAAFYFLSVPFILLWLSPKLAIFVMLPLPIIPFFVVKVGNIIHKRSKIVQEKLADLSSMAQENISGIRVIKTFVRENEEIKRFNKISKDFVESNLSLAKPESGFHPALEFAMGLGICALIYFGGLRVVSGEITLGAFVAFQAYLLKLVWPMIAVGMTINLFQRGMASLGRCGEIIFEPPEIIETTSAEFFRFDNSATPAISVKNLTYCFPGADKPVLSNISFDVPKGGSVALVGPVGSGKSVLINLILRLYEPPCGTVLLFGKDVIEYPFSVLRQIVGYAPQDAFLFSESVLENLILGLKDKNDIAKLPDILEIAKIKSEIEELPNKENTLLGERGVNLSGGQKQRLTLARALARDPEILILDDVMSAVDADTEEAILGGLCKIMKNKTTIIVSHRLSSIKHVDQILFIDQGKIIERGTHEQLLKMGGRYAKLWEKQQLKNIYEEELETLQLNNSFEKAAAKQSNQAFLEAE